MADPENEEETTPADFEGPAEYLPEYDPADHGEL